MIKKKILIFSIVIFPLVAFANISKDDENKLINCTGIYYAYSMIPQGQLELDKIVYSVAAKKFLNSYLIENNVNEEKLNKELLKIVDELYGKPYNGNSVKKCDEFVYKIVPNSKDEILKIVNSGIY
tara:strand:- start:114 stop:491 length:378 start_codon:yes stop_codon:yes gene_type:complete